MKSEHQQRVEEFMRLAGQEVPEVPTKPSNEVRILRAKLIFEEAMETITQGLGVTMLMDLTQGYQKFMDSFKCDGKFNMVETIDGCIDLSVVNTGTLSALGVPDLPFLEEVDKNNLAKFGPGGYRADGTDEKPGPVGKWMKPPGHKPPDIAGVLDDIRREAEGFPSRKECLENALGQDPLNTEEELS